MKRPEKMIVPEAGEHNAFITAGRIKAIQHNETCDLWQQWLDEWCEKELLTVILSNYSGNIHDGRKIATSIENRLTNGREG